MSRAQDMVAEFHRATGATIGDTPAIRDAELRSDLILEEAHEFAQALFWQRGGQPNFIAAIDALADLLYVVYGAAVTFGIDMDPFFAEVHRSNMTKVGGPVREDGKRLKPDTYERPNLLPILDAQRDLSGDKPLWYSTRFVPSETERFEFVNCTARVHPADACEPEHPCPIHRPSDHKMRDWPMLLRETGLIERVCPHGTIGHPDPDSAAWLDRHLGHAPGTWGTHGCDGCCA